MAPMNIQRDARVEAVDGHVGYVQHVIVDAQTREVTDLVVAQDGEEWLVPMSAVAGVEGDRVRLRGAWSEVRPGAPFDRDEFVAVEEDTARNESERRAAHGGAPLLDADVDAVQVGDGTEVIPQQRPQVERDAPTATDRPYRLQLAEERLRVEKDVEAAGTVTVAKRVTEHPETVEVPVRVERVVIERRPGSGEVVDEPIGDDQTIEVPVMEERLEVSKEVVVREEIVVRKETVEHTERVQETLRREELAVEDEAGLVADGRDSGTRHDQGGARR